MPKSAKSKQTAMLQEWYREVIKESVYLETTNCDQFLVRMRPLTLSEAAQKIARTDRVKRFFQQNT